MRRRSVSLRRAIIAGPILAASLLVPLRPHHLGAQAAAEGSPASARAKDLRAALSLRDEAAQVLLIGIQGKGAPTAGAIELLACTPFGGVLLFGFNVPDKAADLGRFTAAVQAAAARNGSGLPFIVAIDDEGGVVFRFHGPDITRLPPPLEAAERGPAYVRLLGTAAGRELRALGVNLALAPVVELLDEDDAAFLGNRSYGRDPATVDAAAGAFIEGLQGAGVAATAKHFPGNAAADPHRGLPRLDIDRRAYEGRCLPRFAAAVDEGVGAVMLSHVLVPALDPANPASLSRFFVTDELKSRLGFSGVALTDDLLMKALTLRESAERSAVAALLAGADLLMLSTQEDAPRIRDAIVGAVESGALSRARLDDAVERVIALKLRFGMEAALDPAVRSERLAAFAGIVEADRKALRDFSAQAASPRD